jgi:hypothetical protein
MLREILAFIVTNTKEREWFYWYSKYWGAMVCVCWYNISNCFTDVVPFTEIFVFIGT